MEHTAVNQTFLNSCARICTGSMDWLSYKTDRLMIICDFHSVDTCSQYEKGQEKVIFPILYILHGMQSSIGNKTASTEHLKRQIAKPAMHKRTLPTFRHGTNEQITLKISQYFSVTFDK